MHACTRLTCISTTTNVMSSVKYAPPSKPVKRHRLKIKVALGVTRWMRSVLSGDHFCRGTHQVSGAFQPPRVQFLPPACQPCQRRLCGLYSDAAAALVLQEGERVAAGHSLWSRLSLQRRYARSRQRVTFGFSLPPGGAFVCLPTPRIEFICSLKSMTIA